MQATFTPTPISISSTWADSFVSLVRRAFAWRAAGSSFDSKDDRMPDASPAARDQTADPHAIVTDVRAQGEALLARVHGEIDINRSPDLRGRLLRVLKDADPAPKRLILNLSDVPYMDSSAVAVLVQTLQAMHERKGIVCLTDVQPRVKGIIEIARLDTIFKICADEAAALKV